MENSKICNVQALGKAIHPNKRPGEERETPAPQIDHCDEIQQSIDQSTLEKHEMRTDVNCLFQIQIGYHIFKALFYNYL